MGDLIGGFVVGLLLGMASCGALAGSVSIEQGQAVFAGVSE